MDWWLVWLISASAFVLLGFVGYHFSVRTLRLFAALLLAMVSLIATRYGVVHSAAGPTDVVNSFIRGFNDLSISFFQPLLGRDVHVPGRFGWFVILAVLVFGYRELEVWAMRWESPAVDTSALGGDQPGAQSSGPPDEPDEGTTDAQRHDRLVAELRFRLPAVSVRAPAILPGGTRSNGLASIAENSGVSGSGLAGAIIRFFGALWPNPRRYQVRVWIEPRERSGHGRPRDMPAVRVTVDVENPRTGESIATKTLAADDCDQAASMIAGYVARHIFKEDPTAPPWCVGSFDGGDLAVMLLAGQQRVAPASPDEIRRSRCQQISMLEKMYWPLRERQSFHDGARVAELLVAIRQCQPGRAGREVTHVGSGRGAQDGFCVIQFAHVRKRGRQDEQRLGISGIQRDARAARGVTHQLKALANLPAVPAAAGRGRSTRCRGPGRRTAGRTRGPWPGRG